MYAIILGMEKKRGLLITFEGSDGAGKSTQIQLLQEYLREKGYQVIISREPGGTVIGERIREILKNPDFQEMSPVAEALLFAASRSQHVAEVVRPALEKGYIVLLDRYIDSSLAYQGFARGLGWKKVMEMNDWATGGLLPDLTFFLFLEGGMGLKRKEEYPTDRFEGGGVELQERVIQGYRELARLYPQRIVTLDATMKTQDIFGMVKEKVEERIRQKGLTSET
ncbi:dTMP kinase [Candidatus Hakubella thermalkaliphila]|uniref:dTMP kinase n=1 Tax=Candidatus Hakubella thermalkaliphila TaxID=2754717 RepID=UPI001592E5E0|nr:dTMP kinase [Candidatus Hakubella thermalkaliphila]